MIRLKGESEHVQPIQLSPGALGEIKSDEWWRGFFVGAVFGVIVMACLEFFMN